MEVFDRAATGQPDQAEAAVVTVGDAMLGGNVAAKADLQALEQARRPTLDAKIAGLRSEMANKFEALYHHLRLMVASIVGATVALVKLVPQVERAVCLR